MLRLSKVAHSQHTNFTIILFPFATTRLNPWITTKEKLFSINLPRINNPMNHPPITLSSLEEKDTQPR